MNIVLTVLRLSSGRRLVNFFTVVAQPTNAFTTATTAEHLFWVASSNLTILHNEPFLRGNELPHAELKKYSPWVSSNWGRELLVTRRPVYPNWT